MSRYTISNNVILEEMQWFKLNGKCDLHQWANISKAQDFFQNLHLEFPLKAKISFWSTSKPHLISVISVCVCSTSLSCNPLYRTSVLRKAVTVLKGSLLSAETFSAKRSRTSDETASHRLYCGIKYPGKIFSLKQYSS